MKRILLLSFMLSLTVAFSAIAQRTVSGKVTSAEDGSVVPGVNVILKGTTTGTTTDLDGNYRLSVPEEGGTLVFTFIGLTTQEIAVGSRSVLDVAMVSDIQQLTEVVVIGYGEIDKRKLTSSITSISGDKISSLPVPSFDQALAGRSSGVQVTTTSGVLGTAPRIRIRGTNSITSGAQPLIVVDGIPMIDGNQSAVAPNNALADINPADIASYEVLKDGAATAIYGSRAANGVILITTKGGKSGQTRVNYNTYFGVNNVASRFDLLNAEEFIRISNEKFATAGLGPQAFPGSNNEDTDWQDVIFRSGAVQSHNLDVSGGNDGTRFFLSAGHTSQEGAVVNNSIQRTSLMAKVDYSGVKWLDMGAKLQVSRQLNSGLNTGTNSLSGNVSNASSAFPNIAVMNPNHPTGYNITPDNNAMGRGNNLQNIAFNLPNIKYVLDNNIQDAKNFRTLANVYAQLNLFEGFKIRSQAGFDIVDNTDFLSWNSLHGDGRPTGYVYRGSYQVFRWNVQNTVSYDKSFAGKHNVNITLGNENQLTQEDFFTGEGQEFSDSYFLQHGLITGTYGTQFSSGGVTESGFRSLFARLNYDFDSKYLVSLSVRNDALSDLPEATRQGTFLGASLGWNIANEAFFGVSTISTLKLRGSLAQTGNVNIGLFPYLGTYGPELYGTQTAIRFEQVGNADLRWETSSKTNVGLDFGIFKDRITGSFDWYKNEVTDLILEAPTPGSLGIPGNEINKNVGSMVNSGIEITLNSLNMRKGDFEWNTTFNVTTNQNEITALNNDEDIIFAYTINRVGNPISSFFGYQYEGVNAANGNPMYKKADGTIIQGNPDNNTYYVYDPANPNSFGEASTPATTLGQSDKVILGQANPTFFGGLGNSFAFKGFAFDIFLQYAGGNKVLNVTRQEAMSMQFSNNHRDILKRWTPQNPNTDVPRLDYNNDNFLNLDANTNSRFLEDGDFIRVQNVSLSYTLPSSALNTLGLSVIRNLRVYAQVQNAFVFTKYSGLDPELNTNNTTNSAFGVDYNTNPLLRTYTFGLNIGI